MRYNWEYIDENIKIKDIDKLKLDEIIMTDYVIDDTKESWNFIRRVDKAIQELLNIFTLPCEIVYGLYCDNTDPHKYFVKTIE